MPAFAPSIFSSTTTKREASAASGTCDRSSSPCWRREPARCGVRGYFWRDMNGPVRAREDARDSVEERQTSTDARDWKRLRQRAFVAPAERILSGGIEGAARQVPARAIRIEAVSWAHREARSAR